MARHDDMQRGPIVAMVKAWATTRHAKPATPLRNMPLAVSDHIADHAGKETGASRLGNRHGALPDHPYRLKLELAGKPPSLH